MLPVGSVAEDNVRPPADRQEPTAGCVSCGESGHATLRCPVLDESFPFLPPGWRADRMDDEFVIATAPKGSQLSSSGKRRLIRGGGLVARISDNYEPQFPVVSKDLPCLAARDVAASRVGAVRSLESVTQRSRVIRNSFRLPCSDSEESDHVVSLVGAVRPLANAAPLGGVGMMDDCQERADSTEDVFSMGARGPINRPGMCCARLDDFDWVVPPYEPDLVLVGRNVDIGVKDVGRDVLVLLDVFQVKSQKFISQNNQSLTIVE